MKTIKKLTTIKFKAKDGGAVAFKATRTTKGKKKKRRRCSFCEKRYVNQQEWKTQIEKRFCLSCLIFQRSAGGVLDALQQQLGFLGMKDHYVKIEFVKRKD